MFGYSFRPTFTRGVVGKRDVRYVWVIETRVDGRWEPTKGMALSREAGRREMQDWRESFPGYHFRLRRYVPMEERDE